ncbi:MAG: ATP-binding cassette domain-containing protein [Candidatus Zixiibacteriota bacterium]|nr:MAG: ATP-binding cassette domain-containing protein [candidate division Zixibacteria bacterium]
MIKLENVTYRYTDSSRPALQNISLEIKPGEAVCVMGANGSGKSTFAKLLAGLIEVQQGQLKITNTTSKPIPVGMIFQNPDNQMVAVTVEKELAFALENLGMPQREMELLISENLGKFKLAHLRQRLTSELSGGEKQRVALASVMIFQPDILVLDEPDSFLDEEGKAALRMELDNIRKQRPSMVQIHISQYPYVAYQYDRLLVFDRGEIIADDEPRTILNNIELCDRAGLCYPDVSTKRVIVPGHGDTERDRRAVRLTAIKADAVRFAYTEEADILRNLTFDFKAGEIVGVVGLSGSGKSTLGNLLCALLEPTAGRISYLAHDGEDIDSEKLRGSVTGVFQQPERQFFLPTCLEEVNFGPENFGRTPAEQQSKAFFAMVGLEADTFGSRDPFSLSGGEKRRLAFAAVLSMSPRFVVFDEPTCGLDPEGVGRFIALAKALKDMGTGLVIISHDGQVIHSLAEHIIYLRNDASNLVLSPTEFFGNPQYRRVVSPLSNQPA